MSLQELKTDIDDDAALHLPDYQYDPENSSMDFKVLPMSTLIPGEPDTVGVRIVRGEDGADYMLSDWARQQLLALLGAREKWFSYVDLERQAEELNQRRHALSTFRIRTAKAVDSDFPVRFVRGVVSNVYMDIPNTEIMSVVVEKMPPEARALRLFSGLTDRAFYAYLLTPTAITIPGTSFFAHPGVVVKNSDVGYTSLYVIPMMVIRGSLAPVVFASKTILKRIHRGKVDIDTEFASAFTKSASLWADFQAQIPRLAGKQYIDMDDAVRAMRGLLVAAESTKELIHQCTTAYRAAPRKHTALDIFEVVSEVCAKTANRDDGFLTAAIAGSVLFHLVF